MSSNEFQRFGRIVSSVAIGIVFAFAGSVVSSAAAGPSGSRAGARQAIVSVKGLSCPVCARRLQKVLAALPGAKGAKVELAKEQAVIEFAAGTKTTTQQIVETVREAGFVPGRIEWTKSLDHNQDESR